VKNLFKTPYTKFYQNEPSFTEDMTYTFWLTFYWEMVLEFLQNNFYTVV